MTTSPFREPEAPPRPEGAIPRVAVSGTMTGLFLMSFFTVLWAGNTFSGWPFAVAWAVFGCAVLVAGFFVVTGVRLLRARTRFPAELDAGEQEFRKRSGRVFGIVFGAEGVAIWLASMILGNIGLEDYIVPVIALIVGLHFYPMARVFRRTIDLYLATWTSLVALTGIVVLATTGAAAGQVAASVGLGAALATTTYGVYMSRMALRMLRVSAPSA